MKKIFPLIIVAVLGFSQVTFSTKYFLLKQNEMQKAARAVLKEQILKEAEWALGQQPVTLTASHCMRSAGGLHDFFSEADYYWPNPENPDGPYIPKDGITNPDNFVEHRKAMVRFSKIIGALASAYKITGDEKYVKHAVIHLKAWFIESGTMMNANLQFAQAIKGRFTGRSSGIIDSIHLIEIAQGTIVMEGAQALDPKTLSGVRNWFSKYINWLTASKAGVAEKLARNNHATCWAMQVASFAQLCNDQLLLNYLRAWYKQVLLPSQMAGDGSFPLELTRTKPYGYSVFNLDAMAMLCQVLSTAKDNLWYFKTPDGKSIKKGIDYLYPFVVDKNKWPSKHDVMYWDKWPVAQPFLLFAANAFNEKALFLTWKTLDHDPQTAEVIRNLPVRHPLLWM